MLQLVQLRWIAVGGQVATIAFVQFGLGVALPLAPMAAVVAALVALNLSFLARLRWRRSVSHVELFLTLAFDASALTAQLYLSGGATNPFAFLFLLHVTLAAVLLQPWATWTIAAVTVVALTFLVFFNRPLMLPAEWDWSLPDLQIAGMLICFALDAGLLAVFVARISKNLRERDLRLAAMRQRAAEEEHIVRMGLLASGAAHELGTPLATLDVILSDWRRMPKLAKDKDLAAEIADMQEEVRRCKTIVTGILMSAGEARGEAPAATTVRRFLEEIVADRRSARAGAEIELLDRFGEDVAIVSDSALKQVIGNVVDNAVEAPSAWVGVEASREGEALMLTVRDAGPGFAPEILRGLGKPYVSSKGKPGGGLGLFLVVNVVRKLGGVVEARNRPEGGAAVSLTLPLEALAVHGGRQDAA
ncbi:HAMP domain-containing histidine kinase [Hansschlegelia zhihuaiae]|uniref:histidine kinase n=2 Tax=Hansschlegelia zhihuaiae TaxID=405005 RepID=A0A4Q0MH74_9HYPH|nr:HAMP domain-containing histidine kinase [Hansschlegelia zhihuaiae]